MKKASIYIETSIISYLAAMHNVKYLLTWNCRHINNPATKPHIREICRSQGYLCPEICTPFEIMELG